MNKRRMTRFHRGKTVRFFKVVILIALVSLLAQPVLAKGGNPRVAPPNSTPYDRTYGEWTAEWWKYAMSFPADTSPLTDATGANCATGQSGPVFFLVGTTGGTAVRDDCVVPVGKSILFPVINFISAVPEDGATADDIQTLCSWATDYIDKVEATVDGVPLRNLLADYRVASPVFSFTGAVGNPFGAYERFRETAFSDGYWVLLRPLSPGPHEIHFAGHFYLPDWDWEFSVDVTYHLTVANPAP
jgi:hypothetical protein